jgi:ATP-dependent Lhr-like helicase
MRADLPWLLTAHRGAVAPAVPNAGPLADIIAVLGERGACFARDLATATGRPPGAVDAALWEGIARGLVASDGFEAVRAVANGRRRPAAPTRRTRLRGGALRATQTAGRWSLVPAAPTEIDRDDLAEAVADQLLERWGVVFRDLAATERTALPWRDLQWALRRMEDRGLVNGGRFVNGFSGEQFALPQAAEALRAMRSGAAAGRHERLSATDPLNLTGLVTDGPRVAARLTESIEVPT